MFKQLITQKTFSGLKKSHKHTAIENFKYIVPTYKRPDLEFTHGEDVFLFDSDGKKYLDFAAGIAVNALGHTNKPFIDAVTNQVQKLTHVSNLFHTQPAADLAKKLVDSSFADQVFFCNSGTEANEGAIKFCRKNTKSGGKKIVAFSNGFHGRTLGALTLTKNESYQKPFSPLIPEVGYGIFNDIESAKAVIDDETCGVFIEPIQGESGITPAKPEFMKALRKICDDKGAYLCFDEVQCGLGRTGYLWAHQNEMYNVNPDIMTVAKPLANGLPIGAILVTKEVGNGMKPGDHGSTFSGGPLVCAAANSVVDQINNRNFLNHVKVISSVIKNELSTMTDDYNNYIKEVRIQGLMVGIELHTDEHVSTLVSMARDNGLIIITAGSKVLRLLPPLVITSEHVTEAISILNHCFEEIAQSQNVAQVY